MYLLLALNIAVAQECPNPVSSQNIDDQLDIVAMGFLEANLDKINTGLTSIEDKIPCLTETLETQVAHEYHMLNGIYNYYQGLLNDSQEEKDAALNHLRLAKRLAPEMSIPTHLFDEDHDIHIKYADAEYIELDSEIPSSDRGVYIFNGQTVNRALNTTNIVQIKEGSNILLSSIVNAGDPLPKAPVVQPTQPTVAVESPATVKSVADSGITAERSGNIGPIFWSSGVAVASLGMLGTRIGFCGGMNVGSCDVGVQDTDTNQMLKTGNYIFLATGVGSAVGLVLSMKNKDSE
jgi:hypothetical protein